MNKHTPAPWTVHVGNMRTIQGPDGRAIAQALHAWRDVGEMTSDEREANERLIAAAPEMLAALQKICDDIPARPNLTEAGRVSLMADAALAAINKATA